MHFNIPKDWIERKAKEEAGLDVTAGAMPDTTRFVWCAEAPDYPGYYALKEPRLLGKIGELGQELGTPNIHEALQFETKEECEAWINGNHLWKATEHGIG